jgi:cytochrome b
MVVQTLFDIEKQLTMQRNDNGDVDRHVTPLASTSGMRKASVSRDTASGARMPGSQEAPVTSVPVWDLPIRLFHWVIVVAIAVSWWSAEYRVMNVHRYSGYTLLGLIVFRLYWGIVGSPTARFAHFVRGPGAIASYLRDSSQDTHGHNPLGGWSVVVMLVLLLTQVTLGLFVTDIDGLESGPLSYLVSFEASRELAESHELVFNILLGFTVLHVAAVLFYLFARRRNLVAAMVTGRKPATPGRAPDKLASLWRIWPGVALAAIVVWFVTKNG